jgi:hypothetical protein
LGEVNSNGRAFRSACSRPTCRANPLTRTSAA